MDAGVSVSVLLTCMTVPCTTHDFHLKGTESYEEGCEQWRGPPLFIHVLIKQLGNHHREGEKRECDEVKRGHRAGMRGGSTEEGDDEQREKRDNE